MPRYGTVVRKESSFNERWKMSKHAWRILVGAFVVFTPFLLYKVLRFVVSYGDSIWNDLFLQKFWFNGVPAVGFLLLLLVIYCVGWFRETRAGAWLYEKFIERIPIFGKIFVSPNVQSQEVLRRINGFVFGPIWGGYRPARITAVFRIKGRDLWTTLTFPMFPVAMAQSYPGHAVIYAIKRTIGEHRRLEPVPETMTQRLNNGFTVFSTEIGLRIEFTGGTTVPEDAFINLSPVTLEEFLKSQRLLEDK